MKLLYRHKRLCQVLFCALLSLSTTMFAYAAPVGAITATKHQRAAQYFDFSPTAREAYQKIISLRLVEARTLLDKMKREEPNNLIGQFLENHWECISVLLSDNQADYKRFGRGMNSRLDKLARGDRQSPYYLYTQASIRLQWGALRVKNGDNLAGLSDIKQGCSLLEENQRQFPDFVANKIVLSLAHAAVGNIPDEYRWILKAISGLNGTISQGVTEATTVVNYANTHADFEFKEEAIIAYTYLQLHLNNQPDLAWNTIKNSKLDPKTNPLIGLVLANVGMRTGHTDEGIRYLQDSPVGGVYAPFPFRYFILGIAKTTRLDTDASVQLEAFLKNYNGKYGVKEAYQKLAWCSLIRGDEQGYWNNIYQAKIQGIDRADTDKAAEREGKSGEMPDTRLLRARLLFDGGYFQRAYDELVRGGNTFTNHRKHNLEYSYRLGRICHKLGRSGEAIRYYNQTIDGGITEPWYFACNAALQLGLLYEDRKEWANARAAYQRCLKISPDEYAASLHARAKTGVSRVKGK